MAMTADERHDTKDWQPSAEELCGACGEPFGAHDDDHCEEVIQNNLWLEQHQYDQPENDPNWPYK